MGSAAVLAPAPALARETPPPASQQVRLPAQSLGASLRIVSTQFGRNISMSSDIVAGRSAPAIDGRYSFEEAVAVLLRDTGLVAVPAGQGLAIRRARAAAAGEGDPVPDEDIVVTGSRIRGAPPAGARVVTIDRADIEQSGYATTQQIVQALPQNFGGGLNEGTIGFTLRGNSNANLGYGSSVNLRGLGATSTLTLVDGNRVALGGVSGMFVDLSLIPASAIERVEVLADGASAIYGSDAVAGVVNVRLRNDYEGAETRARFGSAKGFEEWQFGQIVGAGWSSGHLTLGYEYYRRGNLAASDRAYVTEDLRAFGGPDYRKSFANPGTIIAADGSVWGIPRGQDGSNLAPSDLLAGQPNLADGRANSDILPRQERHAAFASLTQSLAPWLRFTAQGFYAERDSVLRVTPDNYGNIIVRPDNPFYVDPIGTGKPVVVNYDFTSDLGPQQRLAHVSAWSGNAGLEATVGRWRAELRGSYGVQRERNRSINIPNYYHLGQALADLDPATAYNLFGDGSVTPRATVERVRGFNQSEGTSRVGSVALKLDGPLFELPGGPARLAVGGEIRWERYNASSLNYDRSPAPVDGGSAGFPINRRVAAGYAEVSLPLVGPEQHIPLVEGFDLSLAGRIERYDDFGTTANPKIGATWKIGGGLALRGSWGKSFRAPGFADIRTGRGTAAYIPLPVPDPASPTGTTNVLALIGSNPEVGPEKADTWTLGAVYAPPSLPGLRFDIGYFDISYRNRIANLATDYMSFLTNRALYQALITDDPSPDLLARYYGDGNFRNPFAIPAGAIRAIVDGRTLNLSSVHMNGLDFDLGYGFSEGKSAVAAGVSGAWIFRQRQRITPTAPSENVVSTTGNPVDLRLRGRLTLSNGPWSVASFVNFVNGYHNTSVLPAARVSSWTTVDVQLAYDLDRLVPGTRLALSVSNLFDRKPPYVENANIFSASGYDPDNASPVGRLVALQLVKTW
ncbi:TonB-dependent receptor [Sphingopyxis sp.]|uniref:TonB-dependent receptor n=1 Tax=Sphingopyxis sp. TaxID=1908224 RepID=UPI002ED78EFF